MNRSLVETYYYGHGDWPSVFSPAADSVYKQPVREMQMINIARQQLAAQERARNDIIKSNIAGAQIIACEMERQTQALEGAIQGMGKHVTDAIGASADQIIGAIEELGHALCMELSEIRWQLSQQSATLEAILEVLSESRSNEARQLVRQGLRHYLNGEYAEAEERFRKALNSDTTDYQVLMNLAFISLHKNDADEAFSFFKKALSLPENLDDASKARNLWATARLFYSEKDFAQAQAYAEKAFRHEQAAKEGGLFKLGVYQALAGQEEKAIGSLRNAIDMDPALFGRCAVEPDLLVIRDRVISLLAESASGALKTVEETKQQVEALVSKIEAGKPKDDLVLYWIGKVKQRLKMLDEGLKAPTYVFLVKWQWNLSRLRVVLQALVQTAALCKKKRTVQENVNDAKARVEEMGEVQTAVSNETPGCIWPLLYYLIPMISALLLPVISPASGMIMGSTEMKFAFAILWPLLGLIALLGVLVGVEGAETYVGRIFLGLLIDVGIMVVHRAEMKIAEATLDAQKREKSDRCGELSKANRALSDIEGSIREKDKQMEKAYESLKRAWS